MTLLHLPPELLLQVLQYVEKPEWLQCSLVCWHLRHLSTPLLFQQIYANWSNIDQIPNFKYSNCVKSLLITKSSSWGEWHNDLHGIERCESLTYLNMTISGTSSWIKYLPKCKLKRMTITSQYARDRRSNADNSQVELLPLFDIGDLHTSFPDISELTLEGFRVRNDTDAITNISDLTLLNCAWDYPFEMNVGQNLDKLCLKYTRNYSSLTHLERVKTLAIDPPQSLTSLTLHFELGHMQKSWLPLTKYQPPRLEFLKLVGFEPPTAEFFEMMPTSLKRVELDVLSMDPSIDFDLSKRCPKDIDLGVNGMYNELSRIRPRRFSMISNHEIVSTAKPILTHIYNSETGETTNFAT